MGKTLMDSSERKADINLLSPEQQSVLGQLLGGDVGQLGGQAFSQFLQPYSPEQTDDVFQKSIMAPTMQQYERQVLPAIQQRFVDANAGSSSALNQTLAQSATDLGTMLGGQYGQMYGQQQQNQLQALGGIGNLLGTRTFEPHIQQTQGILGPMIGAAGQIGGGYATGAGMAAAMSSEKVKENIKPYSKGLDVIKNLDVKIYDYIKSVGGEKNKVGVIAEKLPEEIQVELEGIKAVDLYGLIGLLINSVKELNNKIAVLEVR